MKNENFSSIIVAFMIIISITIIVGALYKKEGTEPLTPYIEQVDTIKEDTSFMNKTPKEGLMDALKYYGVHHEDIVYAQAILETGHFKSDLCINNNNLFGLYDSKNKRYYSFTHWTESVKGYRDWVQYKWKPPDEDYYEFLSRITYATGSGYINLLKNIVRDEQRRSSKRDTSSS